MEVLSKKTSSKNVDQVDNKELNSELVSKEEIKNSPFHVVTIDGESFGVMGDYRLTEKNRNKKEVIKQLKSVTWNRVIQVIMILEEIKNKNKK